MTKTIEYNELRKIKDRLPDGSIHQIAEKLNLSVETVRNYFGGHDYKKGESCGIHIESGPYGGIVSLDDTRILDMALEMLNAEKN
ncbi:hypothetical protein [Dysgonomonas macrotermitis]|uniref:DNA-binding protein n=1 Tax=Dysgonomonas macrotermitis TaxID=1346286 RepID=A0A1M5HRS9_9BACT|nr:hypothetical protein [Dysgonomonas macrotermitis]SHG18640.1 hypothetical protein SAMN05444362_11716 [Dysgonomonas macrotermitis]